MSEITGALLRRCYTEHVRRLMFRERLLLILESFITKSKDSSFRSNKITKLKKNIVRNVSCFWKQLFWRTFNIINYLYVSNKKHNFKDSKILQKSCNYFLWLLFRFTSAKSAIEDHPKQGILRKMCEILEKPLNNSQKNHSTFMLSTTLKNNYSKIYACRNLE